jgi:enediyne biosynthesis protein E4
VNRVLYIIYKMRVVNLKTRGGTGGNSPDPIGGSQSRRIARWPPVAIAALLVCSLWIALDAFQGMGRTTRTPRPIAPIRTDLPPIAVDFRDVAEAAGLTGIHVSGDPARKKFILEATGGGVAIFDADGDGRMDVFVVSGTTLDGTGAGERSTSRLYRNAGGLRFEDITARAGLQHVGWAQGACAGDYDNDGAADLFVTYYGQSALYRNDGRGAFRDVTGAAGLHAATRWDTGCTFVDYDLDGKLDLVVTSYLEFDRSKVPEPGSSSYCQWKGIPVMCGPRGLPFARNRLFHNRGDATFDDVSTESGVGKTSGCYAFTVVAADLDDDGDPDLYVACDSTPSLLYTNRRNGRFEEEGLLAGVALNDDGQEQGGMGVAIADLDEDGHTDIVKTNFSDDVPNVYRNRGDGTFEDRVFQSGLGAYMQYVGWGIHLLDVDHDGRREILMVNGHVYPDAAQLPGLQYRQPRLLYWNVGGGRFKDISTESGPGIREAWSSRGSAVGDLDNDGSLEVVVNNIDARPSLLKNHGARQNWLLVRATGTRANRDALGARVRVFVGERRLSGEVQGGASFLSQNDPRLHFGLGGDAAYARIEIRWPSGESETFPGGPSNRIVMLTQGTGTRVDQPSERDRPAAGRAVMVRPALRGESR